MTYQELISQIRDFGFAEDSEMQDFGDLVKNDINHAISTINMDVDPIIDKYEFEISGTDEGYLYISMPDVVDNFLDFAETPVLYAETTAVKKDGEWTGKETPIYKVFSDYDLEGNDTLVINADDFHGAVPDKEKDPEAYTKASLESYSIRISYRATHTPFTGTELDDTLPLKLRAHHLVPMLAAYYIWLDDEPVKAAQYYNLYEQAVQTFKDTSTGNRPRMRVLKGGI